MVGHIFSRACSLLGLVTIIFLVGCSEDTRKQRLADYHAWQKRLKAEVEVTPLELEGIWTRQESVYLYKDELDERFNSANSKKPINTSHLLFISDQEFTRVQLRTDCRDEKTEPQWLLAEETPTQVRRVLEEVERPPQRWAAFEVEGQQWVSARPFRLETEALTPKGSSAPQYPQPEYSARVILLGDKNLQVASTLIRPVKGGVYTIIEKFVRVTDKQLAALKAKTKKNKPCPKRREVPNAPPMQPGPAVPGGLGQP